MNRYPDHRRTVIGPDGKPRQLSAQIAPFSFDPPADRLVVDVGEAQERGAPIVSRRVTLDIAPASLQTDADVIAALDRAYDEGGPYGWVKCVKPGCPRWRLDFDTNRYEQIKVKKGTGDYGGDTVCDKTRPLCDECFGELLQAEWEKVEAKEKARRDRQEAKLYGQGFRWAVDAWVHPRRGDDYQVTYYFAAKPKDDEVVRQLAKVSVRTDDKGEPRALSPVAPVPARRKKGSP